MAKQIIAGTRPDQPSLCPTSNESGIQFYNVARNDEQKLAFVRTLCSGQQVIASIQRSITFEEQKLNSVREKNLAAKLLINSCVTKMNRLGQKKLLSEVSGRPLLDPFFVSSEEDAVKARLSQRLFYGATQGFWINNAIQEGCSRLHSITVVDETQVRQWRDVLRVLQQ